MARQATARSSSPAPTPGRKHDPKQRVWQRLSALKKERGSWDSHAKQLSANFLPRTGRFTDTDRNKGGNKQNLIYDNTGTLALRILAAGMMAGMTSPARPWFRLGVVNDELKKVDAVKVWLAEVQSLMLTIFAKSNTYRSLHICYEELGLYGTHATLVVDDFDTVIHMFPLTWGEYWLAADWKGNVNTLYRQFQKSVADLVDEFGWDNVSDTVKSRWNSGDLDGWVSVTHAIEPRRDRDVTRSDALNMPWRSVYFETGEQAANKWLREGGYRRFRVLAPRWSVVGSDIYGGSPAMEALGDVKQLRHEQLRKAQGIDYQTKPPLTAPSSAKGQLNQVLPGSVTYADGNGNRDPVTAMFQVNLQLDHLLADIVDVRHRINAAFYADLFLMLSQSDNPNMTATEVAERHEEKLLMLGPVLERLHNELLSPLIDMVFDIIMDLGIAPPPPPELEGVQVDVEFVSMLAQAQRAVQITGMDRWLVGLSQVASLGQQQVLDKLDGDAFADEYADSLGVSPKLIRPDDQVAAIRKGRAKEQARQAQAAQNADLAKAASELGRVPTQGGGSNMAIDVMQAVSGYNAQV